MFNDSATAEILNAITIDNDGQSIATLLDYDRYAEKLTLKLPYEFSKFRQPCSVTSSVQ